MYSYLPSKRFSIIFLSITVALGMIYFVSFLGKPKIFSVKTNDTEVKTKVQEFMVLDSDNDGLKDWEEALWKTDPKKADTDGDGTSDSEEIILNRDPIKANINMKDQEPTDKVDPKIISADKTATDAFIKLTNTEKISRELFSQYIATRQIDSPLTETEKLQIVENTLAKLPPVTFKTYSEKDLQTNALADNETLKKYSNNIAEIIFNNLKIETESVEEIINDTSEIIDDKKITENAKKIFQRFNPLIAKNKASIDALLKINVPNAFLSEHLIILNFFQEIYEGLDLMQKSAEDLIMLIPLINTYFLSTESLTNSIADLTNKINAMRIIYPTTKDYGYQLFNVIMYKK